MDIIDGCADWNHAPVPKLLFTYRSAGGSFLLLYSFDSFNPLIGAAGILEVLQPACWRGQLLFAPCSPSFCLLPKF